VYPFVAQKPPSFCEISICATRQGDDGCRFIGHILNDRFVFLLKAL